MVLVKKLERNTIKSVTNSSWGLTFYCNTLLAWAREVFSILNENSFGKMKNIYDWIFSNRTAMLSGNKTLVYCLLLCAYLLTDLLSNPAGYCVRGEPCHQWGDILYISRFQFQKADMAFWLSWITFLSRISITCILYYITWY